MLVFVSRSPAPLTWAPLFVVVLVLGLQKSTEAAPRDDAERYITSNSACPAPEATWQELQGLIGEQDLATLKLELAEPWARVVDHGQSYEVQFEEESRSYPGANRDCEERAKIAAVFIALKLNPSQGKAHSDGEESDALTPPASTRLRPVPAEFGTTDYTPPEMGSWRPAWSAAGVSLSGSVAMDQADTHDPSLSLLLDGGIGRGSAGVSLNVGAALPGSIQMSETTVSTWRVPAELTLVLRSTVGIWRISGEGGLAVNTWRFQGRAGQTESQWRALLGGILKVSGCYCDPAQDLGFSAALFGSVFPKTHSFQLEPVGEVGKTSQVWFGARAGVVWDLGLTSKEN